MTVQDYIKPRAINEAISLLRRGRGKAAVVAGGFSLAAHLPAGLDLLIDITGLGLDYVKASKTAIRIGAAAPVALLAESPPAGVEGALLTSAARAIGSTPNRNLITVGGNIVQLYPWADLPVALLALEASVEIAGPRSVRTEKAVDFFRRHPSLTLRRGEIVTEIIVRRSAELASAAFVKFSPTVPAYCLVDCAAALIRRRGSWSARVALSGSTVLPLRLAGLEKKLQDLDPGRMVEAVEMALPDLLPVLALRPDFRAPVEYRRELTGRAISEAVALAVERLRGAGKKR